MYYSNTEPFHDTDLYNYIRSLGCFCNIDDCSCPDLILDKIWDDLYEGYKRNGDHRDPFPCSRGLFRIMAFYYLTYNPTKEDVMNKMAESLIDENKIDISDADMKYRALERIKENLHSVIGQKKIMWKLKNSGN